MNEYIDKIICGDSAVELTKMPDRFIDIVMTSPPYNIGIDYGKYSNDAQDWDEYFDGLFSVLEQCIRVLKHGGRMVINIAPSHIEYMPTHHIISQRLRELGLIWRSEIIWEKHNFNSSRTAWGSWKSPASPFIKPGIEFLEVFCKGDVRKEGDSANIDIDADSFLKWINGQWSMAAETRDHMDNMGHGAMYPEELVRRSLLLFSYRGDVVLDPYMGTGTTAVVAKANGRKFVGVEINPDYYETAMQRLSEVQVVAHIGV